MNRSIHMKTHGLLSVVALLLCSFLPGCGKPAPPTPPPPSVSVVLPVAREVEEWDEYIGRLESPETVEVRARVSGYLDKVHFKEGSEVKKGDLLFTIDPRPYQAVYDYSEADYQRAQSQADLAKNDSERARQLFDTKAISEEEFDTKAKSFTAAQANALAAKARAASAKLDLEFTEIRAPINGRISRAIVTEGNLISGGASGASATLLTTIVSLDPLYFYGEADERAIQKYSRLAREGKRVSARDQPIPSEMGLAGEAGFPYKGVLDFVDNRVDPNTGTLRARGVFSNEHRNLVPGFFARIRIPGSGKYQALLIPDRAVGSDQALKFVYVVNAENKVEHRTVTLGMIIDGLRVVKEGLKPDEPVIVEGQMRVRPGIVVAANRVEAK